MLTISNIGISVDRQKIVDNLSLTIESGSVHALMGPNGSGKSSLSLSLSGHPAYSIDHTAQIEIDGRSITDQPPEHRAKLGLFLTFQNPVAIPGLNVKQLIKLETDHIRLDKPEVKAILTEIKQYSHELSIKPELLDRSINENFSGGEKKRIEMLQLLMARPKYAIIDEIDSGLDVDAIKAIGNAINYAKQTFGTGFLIITHYRRILDYVKPDFVHILAHGNLVQSGGQDIIEEIEKNGYGSYQHQ